MADTPDADAVADVQQFNCLTEEITRLALCDLAAADFQRQFLSRVLQALTAPAGSIFARTEHKNYQLQCRLNPGGLNLNFPNDARLLEEDLLRRAIDQALPRFSLPESYNPLAGVGPILLAPVLLRGRVECVLEVFLGPARDRAAVPELMHALDTMARLASIFLIRRNSACAVAGSKESAPTPKQWQEIQRTLAEVRSERERLRDDYHEALRQVETLRKENAEKEKRARQLEHALGQSQERAKKQRADESAATREELAEVRAERERIRKERDQAHHRVRDLEDEVSRLHDETGRLKSPVSTNDEAAAELIAKLDRAQTESEWLRAEIHTLREKLAESEAMLRNHQVNWSLLKDMPSGGHEATAPDPNGTAHCSSVANALRQAEEDFEDILIVWEGAFQSAEDSRFSSPDNVYRALRAIADVGRAFFEAQKSGTSIGPLKEAFRQRVPFKYTSFESQTTLSHYGNERIFRDGQQAWQMQRHLTLGGGQTSNCLQIYFDFDDQSRRVLIGYCGRHLSYARSRT